MSNDNKKMITNVSFQKFVDQCLKIWLSDKHALSNDGIMSPCKYSSASETVWVSLIGLRLPGASPEGTYTNELSGSPHPITDVSLFCWSKLSEMG